MSFRELYEYTQDVAAPIDITQIKQKISELLPGKVCRIGRSTLNVDRLLGYYVSGRSEDTLFYGVPPGCAVIVLAKGLNNCWSRFVELKEVMHLFDDPISFTNSPDELERLLAGMCESIEPSSTRSPQVQSEYECFCMALALFCPESKRVEIKALRDAQSISDLEIAQMLQMPETYVCHLFSPIYKGNVAYLIRE